jgi:hypothetical protein
VFLPKNLILLIELEACLMRYFLYMFLLGLSLYSFPAHAFCEGHNFTAREAALTLSKLNSELINKEIDSFTKRTATLEANLPCMRTPAPPQVFATAYRYIGLGHYFRGDPSTAERWFLTALELNPAHEWGIEELSRTDEVYKIYDTQRELAKSELVPIEGMQVSTPEGTELYIDGRPWNIAAVTEDRPHIVFIVSSMDRHIISRFIVDGNSLPDIILATAEPVQENKRNKRKKKQQDEGAEEIDQMFAVQKVKRVRPKAKTPLLISGAATVAIAGGIYSYTFVTNDDFYSATTSTAKDEFRKKNNNLIVLSAVVAGMGLGVEYAGVMLDGGSSPYRPFIWEF